MARSNPSNAPQPGRRVDDVVEDVYDTYRAVATDVETYRDQVAAELPPPLDVDDDQNRLRFPLQCWEEGWKKSRVVPALLAYDSDLDRAELETVLRILTGLDVLIMVSDELIDTSGDDWNRRTTLVINAAVSSLLAFGSIPDDAAAELGDVITRYMSEASYIPLVEREVQRELAGVDDVEEAMELIRFSYSFRARDISAFATVPGVVSDADRETMDTASRSLHTYRVHHLLFDDVRDVERDLRDGIETPVMWLLETLDDPDAVADRIDDLYRAFDYPADTECRHQLRSLEDRPDDLRRELARSMATLRT